MSDLSGSPEVDDAALDTPDERLNAELGAPDEDRPLEEEDASLLDPALEETPGEEGEGEGEGTAGGGLLEESNDSVNVEDPEIEAIKARVKEMEEEAEKLKEMQTEVEKQMSTKSGPQYPTPEEKAEMDARSVYVGNVDYQSTAEELGQHFQACGPINRVTILCDKFTGSPKGFAYVEFAEKEMVDEAVKLNESLFKGRQIKVSAKRTNRPGITSTNRGSWRGRGRGRGRGFGAPMMMGGYMMVPVPSYPRGGRGRAFRGRARSNWYSPY